MIEDFFNHLCNIYHIKEDKQDIGYGISSTPIFSYSVVPDAENVKCHFLQKVLNILQKQTLSRD
jgi:hypothetical protein